MFNIGRDMGKLGLSLGSNVKGGKSIFSKRKFAHKKVAKKTAIDKSPVEKTSKVYTKGQKGSKLVKSSSSSANKGHKQLGDADSGSEEEVADMRVDENSSDDESEESGSENMQDGSDDDGIDNESDAAQDDDDDDDDVDDDDVNDDDDDDVDGDAPTDIEEPKIKDGGKSFRAKKRARPNCGGKKLSDSKRKRKNYAEPEPVSSKVDGISLTRKKQMELYRPCKWDVCERVKTSELNFAKWMENHNHREQYFIGDDGVSKKRDKIEIFSFLIMMIFLPPSWSLVYIPESSHHEKVY